MNARTLGVLAAVALVAIAAWPAFLGIQAAALASAPTPAPVIADYLQRNSIVAFYERDARAHPDQLITRMLASQYLMRYRETGDVGDLLRGERMAKLSLRLLRRNNINAEMALASAQQSLHEFRDALDSARAAMSIEPWNGTAISQAAGIETELGRYPAAERLLRSVPANPEVDVNLYTAQARYDELTGRLADARRLIDLAMGAVDSVMDNPAEARAWYHFRAGELAWAMGDGVTAERRFREALAIFPNYPRALNGLARMYWGQKRWPEALEAASRAANLMPLPETLGYEADAQRALGDARGAALTEATIEAIERIGNAHRINDRALAIFYSEHGLHAADAVAIARRDVAVRDDVFAEDTLAWALAQSGYWNQAQTHARRALAQGTQDARLLFHAGTIAAHNGDAARAAQLLRRALDLNPQFHPVYADQARAELAALTR